MSITSIYELEMFDYGTSGWDGVMNSNFQKIEAALHSRLLGTLGETVSVGDAIYIKADGKWWKAQANGTDQPCMGVAVEDGIVDDQIRIQHRGPVVNAGWAWTIGKPVFLSAATAGLIVDVSPAHNIQSLGVAIDTDTIFLDGNMMVVL